MCHQEMPVVHRRPREASRLFQASGLLELVSCGPPDHGLTKKIC
jgi:hypothetical protein